MIDHCCNACGSPVSVQFPEVVDPQTLEHFAIETCASCGLGHTTPKPEDIGRYYGAAYHGGRHSFTDTYCMWRRMKMVGEMTKKSSGTLLDFGCGDGSFGTVARDKSWVVSGVEMRPDLARARGLRVEETIQAFAGESFDCITLWHSLEHVRDPMSVIAQLSKLLAPDGTLIIAVPDFGGLQSKVFGKDWFHLDVPRHLFHFTQASMQPLLGSNGLEVKHMWHHEIEIDLFGWPQSLLNKVMPDRNVFFNVLTKKQPAKSMVQSALHFSLGTLLTAAAIPVMPIGWTMERGATMVVAARRNS